MLRAGYFELLDEPERALAKLEAGHEHFPDDLTISLLLAHALDRADKTERAIELLRVASSREPILWLELPRAFLLAERPDRPGEAVELSRCRS